MDRSRPAMRNAHPNSRAWPAIVRLAAVLLLPHGGHADLLPPMNGYASDFAERRAGAAVGADDNDVGSGQYIAGLSVRHHPADFTRDACKSNIIDQSESEHKKSISDSFHGRTPSFGASRGVVRNV